MILKNQKNTHKYNIQKTKNYMAKIKNNVSENTIANHNNSELDENNQVMNWISQINAGGTVYDIATHHSIKFYDGSNDTEGVVWNGLTDIEVVIPSVTDIVNTPVVFAGTVDKDGNISWTPEYTFGSEETVPEAGYLVFITEGCTFEGSVCEAGDMAIFDGTNWKIVTGENQVSIVGNTGEAKTTIAIGSAKDVLTVEGKTLSLTLDYTEINKHLSLTPGKVESVDLSNVKVAETYVKLNKGADVTTEIGKDFTFENATKLTDGTVTFENATGLVNTVNFGTFTPGELPTFTPNSEKTFVVDGGKLDLTSNQTTGDFVDSVSLGAVTFVTADGNDENKIEFVSEIKAGVGQSFLNGIHLTGTDENADFTIKGCIAPTDGVGATFVTGLEDNVKKVVTEITTGDIKLTNGNKDVVVGFGDAGDSGDVISDVTVTANNNTNVLNSATVTDHVLSFGSTNVTSDVTVKSSYKSLMTSTLDYTAPVATTKAFTTGGFTKADDVKYTFDKGNETTYTTSTQMWKLNTPALAVTKGSYEFNDEGMKATIGENSFIATATPGTLPTWTGMGVNKVDITGTVNTALTTSEISFKALNDNNITLPGIYSLEGATDNGVLVGAAGSLTETSTATVDLTDYVTDVTITN